MWMNNMDYCRTTTTANECGTVVEKRSLESILLETNLTLTEALKIMHVIEHRMSGGEEKLPTVDGVPDRCFENELSSTCEMANELLRQIANLNYKLFGAEN